MNKKTLVAITTSSICLLGIPAAAHANAGTPLMWASIIHLVIGNALIGILEGFLLASVFRLKKVKTIGVIILANYASAWIGGLFLGTEITKSLHIDLTNGWFESAPESWTVG